jgi:hypothetical protein
MRPIAYGGRSRDLGGGVKNFPHQYNDLRKLRATLSTVSDLRSAGEDASDDAVLGYELARRGIYGFRRLDYTGSDAEVERRIIRRLVEERQKPAGSQGTRTAAREMRRTLRYLGWIGESGTALTPPGTALLATGEGSDAETALMQQAIASIEVADRDGNISHPVLILLRLIDEIEFVSRAGMQVALEAQDDTAAEFRRITRIALLPPDERAEALQALGWTEPQMANALKILPAFVEQSGLVAIAGGGRFVLTDAGHRALGRADVQTPARRSPTSKARRQTGRRTAIASKDPSEVGRSRRLLGAERRALSPAEQQAAAELLYERTERHQVLVRAIATRSRDAEFHEDAAAYDLVVDYDPTAAVILIEVKTISGDADRQLRAAVGQLLYYEYFAVTQSFPDRGVRKVVFVDDNVPEELAAFLQAHGVGLVICKGDDFAGLNDLGVAVETDLFRATEGS